MVDTLKKNTAWIRHSGNPVLKPKAGGKYGESICMNPYAEVHGEEIYLYYASDSKSGKRQICLTKAPVSDVDSFSERQILIDNGGGGSFDAAWCVLPNTITINGVHHIYYTGNNGIGQGLSAFPGIGLATSSDGKNYIKNPKSPLLSATGKPGDADRVGVAGGSVIMAPVKSGRLELRYYYTGCPTLGEDYFTDQQKCVCYAVSQDGVNWQRRGTVMQRNPEHDYENVAVAGSFVIYDDEINRFRMWYSAIGTRWGYYSICYAESDDGLHWYRGSSYGENLQLGPSLGPVSGLYQDQSWDSQMAAYPAVINTSAGLRLFYTGNSYGIGGIGTALAAPLRAVGDQDGTVRINTKHGKLYSLVYPLAMNCSKGAALPKEGQSAKWHGPCPDCGIWREYTLFNSEEAVIRVTALIRHKEYGLEQRLTILNKTAETIHDIEYTEELSSEQAADSSLKSAWQQPALEAKTASAKKIRLKELTPYETVTLTAKITY